MTQSLDFDRVPSWVVGCDEIIIGHFAAWRRGREVFCETFRGTLPVKVTERDNLREHSMAIDLRRLEAPNAKLRPVVMAWAGVDYWLERWDATVHQMPREPLASDWVLADLIAAEVVDGVAELGRKVTHAAYVAVRDKANSTVYMVGGGEVQIRFAPHPRDYGKASPAQIAAAYALLVRVGACEPIIARPYIGEVIGQVMTARELALSALGDAGAATDVRGLRRGKPSKIGFYTVYDKDAMMAYHIHPGGRVEIDFKAVSVQARGAARLSNLRKAYLCLVRAKVIAPI